MKRVAIFGNAGGGKSTLARELASITGLPLHVLDLMQFRKGGTPVPEAEYLERHARTIEGEEWIIDGFGGVEAAWARFERADTLIHVDLPLSTHFAGVTKRLWKGMISPPPGWPEGSPLLKSSISSYRVLMPCHRLLTPKYREYLKEVEGTKETYSLCSRAQIRDFLASVRRLS